ncbi:hypothetical protein, partial [Paenibacillus xylanexedens]|uniref:hypothetical protein n=1 Tax=Paenibacillus xylanexedens TaxID=528191 RepID=UPI001642F03F
TSAFMSSGMGIGTRGGTSGGMKEEGMVLMGKMIGKRVKKGKDGGTVDEAGGEVRGVRDELGVYSEVKY